MSHWRKTIMVGNQSIDVTSMSEARIPIEISDDFSNMTHVECGGVVVMDADSQGDWWWNFRCPKCGATFQKSKEWLSDE